MMGTTTVADEAHSINDGKGGTFQTTTVGGDEPDVSDETSERKASASESSADSQAAESTPGASLSASVDALRRGPLGERTVMLAAAMLVSVSLLGRVMG